MKKWMRFLSVTVCCAVILGCGGESSSDSSNSSGPGADDGGSAPVVNAAEEVNGGNATASYDNGNADLVNDGDTNDATFWAGSMVGDYVTVAFNREYHLGEIRLHTNRTNSMDTEIQLSTDGSNFDAINLASDCNVGLTMGSGQIVCWPNPEIPATHIRVEITDSSSPGTVEIHEIVARGF